MMKNNFSELTRTFESDFVNGKATRRVCERDLNFDFNLSYMQLFVAATDFGLILLSNQFYRSEP